MNNVALNITLHSNQQLIHDSKARIVVVKSGKRFGKTDLALYKLIQWACARPGGTFWYLTDTFGHAEDIGWKRLLELIPPFLIRRIEKNKLSVTLTMGSEIRMMSADNPERLRGIKLHGIVWEEAAYIKGGMDIWAIIDGQLGGVGDEKPGPAFFISSPNREGRNWFSLFYEDALRRKSLGESWDAFKFTAWDNPMYRREVIQGWKDNCTEDQWEVEYMANESAHAGQIVSEFNHSLHVKDFEPQGFLGRALDWGISHPTGCLWLYTDLNANKVYISDEYKKSGEGIRESCSTIKLITGQRKVEWSVLDPSMFKRDKFNVTRKESDEFVKHGIPVIPANNQDVGYDIMKMFFKRNMIVIHPRCGKLIYEIKTVQWGDEVGEDLLDCLRYGLKRINDIYFNGMLVPIQEEKKYVGLTVGGMEVDPNPGEFSWANCDESYL